MNSVKIAFLILAAILIFFRKIISMFITTQLSGAPISLLDLLAMNFRKVDIYKIGDAYITLRKANIDIDLKDLEAAYLLKHDLQNITYGLIIAKQKNIPLTFEQAKEADKKGIKMLEELRNIDQG